MPHKDAATRKAYLAAYYEAHRTERLAYVAEYHQANREDRRVKAEGRREATRANGRAYWHSHRESLLQKDRARAPYKKALEAAWRKAHPAAKREHGHRRRARLRGQHVEQVNLQAIYERDAGRCHICEKQVTITAASLDHLLPISKGGAHAPWNVRLAHRLCNIRRGNRGAAQLLLVPAEGG